MKTVIAKEEAEFVVVAHAPKKFPFVISPVAREFVANSEQADAPNFQIDPKVAKQTGIAELQRLSIEQQVERLALERVQSIQENAYREAYQLGLDEGRERAFSENKLEFEKRLKDLDGLIDSITKIKSQLLVEHEAHIVKLLFYVARRLVMQEISAKPESILPVLESVLKDVESSEAVKVLVSKSDLEFLNQISAQSGADNELLKRAQFEEREDVTPGGCIVETNYGSIDASLEKRFEKLWDTLAERIPTRAETKG